jgi:hypothetical protein
VITAGWTVAVISRGPIRGTTVRELYDCAVPSCSGAEEAVAAQLATNNTLLIASSNPLTDAEVKELGLGAGQIRKRN